MRLNNGVAPTDVPWPVYRDSGALERPIPLGLAPQTLLERHLRRVAELLARPREVGPGVLDVAGLHALAAHLGLQPGHALERVDRLQQRDPGPAPQVVDGAVRATHGEHDASDDIVDEGEVPRLVAGPVHLQWPALVQSPQEQVEGHVRPLARPVDSEEAEGDRGHAMVLPVQAAELLSGELGDAVGRDRAAVGVLVHGQLVGVSVHRRRRGIDDPGHVSAAARLKDHLRGQHVVVAVDAEALPPARAYARLRREVEDAVGAGEDLVEAAAAGDLVAGHVHEVVLDQGEASREARPCEVGFLERPRVVVLERIDADDLVAGGEQPFDEVRPDESRGAGDDHPTRAPTIAHVSQPLRHSCASPLAPGWAARPRRHSTSTPDQARTERAGVDPSLRQRPE